MDDGNSAVSLPEVPLLGVLPGTGGLIRLVDKRKVRRDHADFFATIEEGIKGKRALEWRLIDEIAPASQFEKAVDQRAQTLASSAELPLPSSAMEFSRLSPLLLRIWVSIRPSMVWDVWRCVMSMILNR